VMWWSPCGFSGWRAAVTIMDLKEKMTGVRRWQLEDAAGKWHRRLSVILFFGGAITRKEELVFVWVFSGQKKKKGDQMRELWLLEEGGLQCSRKLDGAWSAWPFKMKKKWNGEYVASSLGGWWDLGGWQWRFCV
jgi:hypothetical protein